MSTRYELLFLLFKECNGQATVGWGILSQPEMGNPIEAYLKDAAEGVVAAQFIVGLAHLEGYSVEKDYRSAYYWLRMAEENSCTIRNRSRVLVEELRSTVKTGNIEALEHRVAIAVQENKLLRSKHPAEFITPSTDSGPRAVADSTGRKVRVAS